MSKITKLFGSSASLADARQVTVICSTAAVDRAGDVVVQAGIDLTAYQANPIVLWGHDSDVPIARAVNIGVADGKLQATVQFPPEGEDEDSDWVYGKIKSGIVNATSIGFIPRKCEPLDPKNPWDGYRFVESELVEFSFVSVPANSQALVTGRSLFAPDMQKPPSKQVAAPTAKISGRDLVAGVVKDLQDVSWLASLLCSLACLQECVEWEAEYEGDDSPIAGRLAAVLTQLGQILIDMTAEEVAELLSDGDTGAVMMAARTPAQKVLATLGIAAKAAPVERAGRVLSASNEADLRSARDLIDGILSQTSTAEMASADDVVVPKVAPRADVENRSTSGQFPRRAAREIEVLKLRA